MKVFAILGSPRKGNSEILLKTAIDRCIQSYHEINLIRASELSISGCTGCDGCKDTGKCIIHDDMDNVYELIKKSHRIIIATPIFFFGVPAQLKLLIDRCQCLWYKKYVLKKPIIETDLKRKALLIIVGGMKKGQIGVSCAEATLKAFLRTINVNEHKTLSYLGINEAGEIINHPSTINEVMEEVIRMLS